MNTYYPWWEYVPVYPHCYPTIRHDYSWPAIPVAWECPRCHKINAPRTPSCDCKPKGYSATSAPGDGTTLTKTPNNTITWATVSATDTSGPVAIY